jgi:thioredoxin 1
VLVAKCDVEECEEAVAKFGVRNIPTVVFVKGGEVVDKNVGAASKDALKAKIEKLL